MDRAAIETSISRLERDREVEIEYIKTRYQKKIDWFY